MKKFYLLLSAVAVLAACRHTPKAISKQDSTLRANLHADSVAEAKRKADAYRKAHYTAADSAAAPKMAFETTKHNFGTLIKGQKVHFAFRFKNTGPVPLVILSAEATCGCTVADYPHKPVAPGANGEINVVFDSSNADGMISKAVNVNCNGIPDRYLLFLEGKVKAPKK